MHTGDKRPVSIVVVDHSPTARELLIRLFQNSPDFQVIGSAANGAEAIRLVQRSRPNVVTLNIHLPELDGVEATKHIMREAPTPIVIISDSQAPQNIELTFKALQAGALTVLSKPDVNDTESCEKVVRTVRLMADIPVIHHWGIRERGAAQPKPLSPVKLAPALLPDFRLHAGIMDIRVIGIAASTGGPSALAAVLGKLPEDFPVPILAVQHISLGFANGLAEWLNSCTRLEVKIAKTGDRLRPGRILLAPDDYHLQVGERGAIELSKAPAYKGLRPSANYLFHSLARVYGRRALGIVLTGMGDDGAEGAVALHQAGGVVIAQDEQSSVVYGMPHQVVARRAAHQVLSLDQIAAFLELFGSSLGRLL